MSEAEVKQTQAVFAKILKKTPLTAKLLGRPPFKYLFDVVLETSRTTGFAEEIFSPDDLKPEKVGSMTVFLPTKSRTSRESLLS